MALTGGDKEDHLTNLMSTINSLHFFLGKCFGCGGGRGEGKVNVTVDQYMKNRKHWRVCEREGRRYKGVLRRIRIYGASGSGSKMETGMWVVEGERQGVWLPNYLCVIERSEH